MRTTVLFIAAGTTGAWTPVTLTRNGDVWRGADPNVAAGTEIDFIVQAVDAGGNVAMSTNNGAYFEAVEVGPPTIQVAGPFNEQEGWYTGPVDVRIDPFTTGALVEVTVNGPEIRASTSPSLRPSTVPVAVTLVGEDTGIGVGVETIRYRTSGAVTTPETVVDATTAVVTIGATGITKVTAVAVDGLGRTSRGRDRGRDRRGRHRRDPADRHVRQRADGVAAGRRRDLVHGVRRLRAGARLPRELRAAHVGPRWHRDRGRDDRHPHDLRHVQPVHEWGRSR